MHKTSVLVGPSVVGASYGKIEREIWWYCNVIYGKVKWPVILWNIIKRELQNKAIGKLKYQTIIVSTTRHKTTTINNIKQDRTIRQYGNKVQEALENTTNNGGLCSKSLARGLCPESLTRGFVLINRNTGPWTRYRPGGYTNKHVPQHYHKQIMPLPQRHGGSIVYLLYQKNWRTIRFILTSFRVHSLTIYYDHYHRYEHIDHT